MHARRLALGALLAMVVAAGCNTPTEVTPTGKGTRGDAGKGPGRPSTEPSRAVAPQPTGKASAGLASPGPVVAGFTGRVLGIDGKPAVGVEVRGFLISNNGGGVISNNGGSLVSNNGGGLVTTGGGSLVGQTRVPFRVLEIEGDPTPKLVVTTDAEGRFKLDAPTGSTLNVEAVAKPDVKAIKLQVAGGATGLELQLAPTGVLTGKVTAPDAPTVTNFEGIDVFIPGTSYVAKADASGAYTLDRVPAGSFSIVASKAGLGRANIHDVKVESQKTTTAPPLALALKAPQITKVDPPNAAPGALVTITGANFASDTGDALKVTFKGAPATDAKRVDATTLTATVPTGAGSGDVIVEVAGIISNGTPFQVLQKLEITSKPVAIAKGRAKQLTLLATDTAGQPVLTPSVAWTASAASVAVTATGQVTASAAGPAFTVSVASGSLTDSTTFAVVEGQAEVTAFAGAEPGYRDGARDKALFRAPLGVVAMDDGTLFVTENGNLRIRKIAPDGTVSTAAGSVPGYQDGSPFEALFTDLQYIAADADGDLYVTEYAGNRVRKISGLGTPQAKVETLAGSPAGESGDANGPGASARFRGPKGIAVDKDLNVYVADAENSRIRRIRQDDPTHPVTTIVGRACTTSLGEPADDGGKLCGPVGLAMGPDGFLYVADLWNSSIWKVEVANAAFPISPVTLGLANKPAGIAVDAAGNVYVTEPHDGAGAYNQPTGDHRVVRFSPSGARAEVAGASGEGAPGDADGFGATARFRGPQGLAVTKDNQIIVVDGGNHRLRTITP